MILVDIDGSLAATGELLLSRYKIPIRKYPAPMPDGFWSSPEGLAIYRDVEPIPDSVEALLRASEDIAYFTLRPPIAGFVTIRWLQKHGIPKAPCTFAEHRLKRYSLLKSLGLFWSSKMTQRPQAFSRCPWSS